MVQMVLVVRLVRVFFARPFGVMPHPQLFPSSSRLTDFSSANFFYS